MTCPDCGGTGIISRPYIAGVVSTMTACTCDAGREARNRLIIAPRLSPGGVNLTTNGASDG